MALTNKSKRRKSKNRWFRINRSLHRDIGYFCIGLTLIFAVSGIAVNHINDWNPNYSVSRSQISLPGITQLKEEALQAEVLQRTNIRLKTRASFWPNKNQFKIFFEGGSNLSLDLKSETAVFEHIKARSILKRFNALHLNEPKKAWTYFSDFYAGLLIFLSISALFMVRGKKGIIGRGGVYFIAGLLAPLAFILYYQI